MQRLDRIGAPKFGVKNDKLNGLFSVPELSLSSNDHAISVIVPAFNASTTLRCALQSIFSQTSPPNEVIVVDDGSTDDTLRVAEEFDTRVHVLQQVNQGAAAAREAGTELVHHCANIIHQIRRSIPCLHRST